MSQEIQKENSKKPLSQIENLIAFNQGRQSQDQSLKGNRSQSQASQDVAVQYDRQELSSHDSSFSSQEMTPELWIKIQEINYRLIDNGLIQLSDDQNTNQRVTVSKTQSQHVSSSQNQNSKDAKIRYSQ